MAQCNAAVVLVSVLAITVAYYQPIDAKKTLQVTFFAFQNPRGTLNSNGTHCDGDGGCRVIVYYCLEPLASVAWSYFNEKSDGGYAYPWPANNFLSLWSLIKPVVIEMQFGCMRGFRLKLLVKHCEAIDSTWRYCSKSLYIDEFLLDIPENSSFANLTLSGLRPLHPTSLILSAAWEDDGTPLIGSDSC